MAHRLAQAADRCPSAAAPCRCNAARPTASAVSPELSSATHTINPVLHIHRSERADALVAALGAALRTPTGDPFQAETVAVPSRGVERWLAQQLSHVLGARDGDGVCANVVFPSYTRLLDETVAEADDDYAEAVERWSPERAVWPLLRVIDRCAPTEPWCGVLAAHLGLNRGATPHEGRRFAVAAKLAAPVRPVRTVAAEPDRRLGRRPRRAGRRDGAARRPALAGPAVARAARRDRLAVAGRTARERLREGRRRP